MYNVLIVDDIKEKQESIINVINDISNDYNLDIATCIIDAKRFLIAKQYDLMILDIQLPQRNGGPPIEKGGLQLFDEIRVNRRIKKPIEIIGLTAYENLQNEFNDMWSSLHYEINSTVWKEKLKQKIEYSISSISNKLSENNTIVETVFVEGVTDKAILEKALSLFYPQFVDKIRIKSTRKDGGASWVRRQLISWAQLHHKRDDKYIKAVGLFDNDDAGLKEIDEINRVIPTNNYQRKSFKTLKLKLGYANHLIELKKKDIFLPITLEELYPPFCWVFADDKGWLKTRKSIKTLIKADAFWEDDNINIKDYLTKIGLSDEDRLYMKQTKDKNKEDFKDYILQLPDYQIKQALEGGRRILEDIFRELEIGN